MSRAVVILGAGASADFGVPTLQGVFKDAQAREILAQDANLYDCLRRVFWDPRGLTLETSDQGPTIEEILTMTVGWEKEGIAPAILQGTSSEDFRRRLYVLIQGAVFRGKSSQSRHLNRIISAFRRNFEQTTWASFNWDCIFESSFWYQRATQLRTNPALTINIDGWTNGDPSQVFLKLHGGINWWHRSDRLIYLRFANSGPLEETWRRFAAGDATVGEPVILEPSAWKYQDPMFQKLLPQWAVFDEELRRAQVIIVIGYSMPDLDVFARSRILKAFQLNTAARWILVDPGEHSQSVFKRALGSARFTVLPQSLAAFSSSVDTAMPQSLPDFAWRRGSLLET